MWVCVDVCPVCRPIIVTLSGIKITSPGKREPVASPGKREPVASPGKREPVASPGKREPVALLFLGLWLVFLLSWFICSPSWCYG